MTDANPVLVEATRGDYRDRVHRGAFCVAHVSGDIVEAAGVIDAPILPRSAVKLLQALPLVESGAADAARLDDRRLALACASHQGSHAHAAMVAAWLTEIGLSERDLACGVQEPEDAETQKAMRAAGEAATQLHNNCSGKHAGFLTLARRLGAPTERYLEIDGAVQRAVAEAYADVTEATKPLGWAVDGCSAPNFAASLAGLARAFARVASPEEGFSGLRASAARRLRDAMAAHPYAVAGAGRACTELMEAAQGRAIVKTGADGCFTAALPARGLGVAIKIDDGDVMACECAIAALLARYDAVSPADPRVARRLQPTLTNRRVAAVGVRRATGPLILH